MKLLPPLTLLALLAITHVASADAIEGPPACPPGARGRSAHEGQWCVPAPCDAGCEDGERCADRRVCVQTASVIPGGLRPSEPPAEPRELVVATCDARGACTGNEEPPPPTVGTLPTTAPTCTTMRVCVSSALPGLPSAPVPATGTAPTTTSATASAPPPRSCLCAAPGASRVRVPWLALGSLALLIARRRR